jgi:Uma2 family endonuclease
MTSNYERYKLSVRQYDRMVETGILTREDRVELIDGEIIYKPRQSPRHAACRTYLLETLILSEKKSTRGYDVSVSRPIRLEDYSQVEPDVVLLVQDHERFMREHPNVADTFLFIEVTDLAPARNHQIKLPLYARTGVSELWIVDFPNDLLEVYQTPGNDGYQVKKTLRRGEQVSPHLLPSIVLPVAEMLF